MPLEICWDLLGNLLPGVCGHRFPFLFWVLEPLLGVPQHRGGQEGTAGEALGVGMCFPWTWTKGTSAGTAQLCSRPSALPTASPGRAPLQQKHSLKCPLSRFFKFSPHPWRPQVVLKCPPTPGDPGLGSCPCSLFPQGKGPSWHTKGRVCKHSLH